MEREFVARFIGHAKNAEYGKDNVCGTHKVIAPRSETRRSYTKLKEVHLSDSNLQKSEAISPGEIVGKVRSMSLTRFRHAIFVLEARHR